MQTNYCRKVYSFVDRDSSAEQSVCETMMYDTKYHQNVFENKTFSLCRTISKQWHTTGRHEYIPKMAVTPQHFRNSGRVGGSKNSRTMGVLFSSIETNNQFLRDNHIVTEKQ